MPVDERWVCNDNLQCVQYDCLVLAAVVVELDLTASCPNDTYACASQFCTSLWPSDDRAFRMTPTQPCGRLSLSAC